MERRNAAQRFFAVLLLPGVQGEVSSTNIRPLCSGDPSSLCSCCSAEPENISGRRGPHARDSMPTRPAPAQRADPQNRMKHACWETFRSGRHSEPLISLSLGQTQAAQILLHCLVTCCVRYIQMHVEGAHGLRNVGADFNLPTGGVMIKQSNCTH